MKLEKLKITIREKSVIPIILIRHNITVADRGFQEKKSGEEILLQNRFGDIFLKIYEQTSLITPSDTKTFIAVLNCLYDIIHAQETDERKKEICNTAYGKGIEIPFSMILRYRDIKKAGSAYQKVKESLIKIYDITIKSECVWLSSNESKKQDGYFHLLDAVFFTEVGQKKYIKVRINPYIIQSLFQKENTLISVGRTILNSLDGLAFNLFLFLEGQNFRKKQKKVFSYEELIKESHFSYSLCGKKRPDMAIGQIQKALNQLKEKNAILDWKETALWDGRKGVEIFFLCKNSN